MSGAELREEFASCYLQARVMFEAFVRLQADALQRVVETEADLAAAIAEPAGATELDYLQRAARIAKAVDAAREADLAHYRAAEFCVAKGRTLLEAKEVMNGLQ
jgi:hypothetical protein